MIKNERQYKITKAQERRFEASLKQLLDQPPEGKHELLAKAELEAARSQLEEIRSDLAEYEALRQGTQRVVEVSSLQDFPAALIKARIAARLSQKELAERLGMKEQQIQRYEATDYASANIARLVEVARALGIAVHKQIVLPPSGFSITQLLERVRQAGVDDGLLMTRVLPPAVATELEMRTRFEGDESGLLGQLAAAFQRSFGWSLRDLLADRPLRPALAGFAGFKAPAGADARRLQTYALYANTLALLVLQASRELPPFRIPSEAADLRTEIKYRYGKVVFESALHYLWSNGVAVLPLNDLGGFHGACWKIEEVAVVALNQTTQSSARWLFDVLHELKHLLDAPETTDFSLVELAPISPLHGETEEEVEANNFAEDVMLDSRADELAELCVGRADHRLELLKGVIPEVAAEEGVEADALANHLAFRLCEQGEDWWGAATNLQMTVPSPFEIARRLLLENTDLSKLEPYDAELLLRSQSPRSY